MRIGIDLGGTKIEGIVLAADGNELIRERVSTPGGDYRATLDTVHALVLRLESRAGEPCSVGIGMPGSASRATALLDRPLRFANDADCFALSEARDGAAAGAAVVFGVIVGTGTGGGIVVDERLLQGPNGIAGEWGHNPLPWPGTGELPGPACYCGLAGCIETWLSGPALTRDHRQCCGESLDAAEISRRALAGDTRASETVDRYTDRMARALASVINIIDPEVIVLGGGLSNMTSLYEDVPRRWGRYVFSDRVDTRLVPARHGDSSGVRGAAWLWPD
jgi:fructokinase